MNKIYCLRINYGIIKFNDLVKALKSEEITNQIIKQFNCTIVSDIELNDAQNFSKSTETLKSLRMYFELKNLHLYNVCSCLAINNCLLITAVGKNILSLSDYKLLINTLSKNNIKFKCSKDKYIFGSEKDITNFKDYLIDNGYFIDTDIKYF